MKTFHRVMFENLTEEEWKELLKVDKEIFGHPTESILNEDHTGSIKPGELLQSAFLWKDTEQGHKYWSEVASRLMGIKSYAELRRRRQSQMSKPD